MMERILPRDGVDAGASLDGGWLVSGAYDNHAGCWACVDGSLRLVTWWKRFLTVVDRDR